MDSKMTLSMEHWEPGSRDTHCSKVEEKIREFEGEVFFTRDTHEACYLETQEGKNLPVPHCIRETEGWQIRQELDALRETEPIDKGNLWITGAGKKNLLYLTQRKKLEVSLWFGTLYRHLCDLQCASDPNISSGVPISVDAAYVQE